MPDDLVDSWDTPPRRRTGRGGRVALVGALDRGVPHVIGHALVLASGMLVAGQLFAAYRTLWPANDPGRFQLETDDMSIKLAYLIATPFTAVPLLVASLPVLALAGLTHLPPSTRPPVAPPLRLVAGVVALVVSVVGVVLVVAVTGWALVTHGTVGTQAAAAGYFSTDPVTTVLSRGGDGLATAVLAAVAGWLLWTRSADVRSAATDTAPHADGARQAETASADVVTPTPAVSPEETGSPLATHPAYRNRSAEPGTPAPFVTRGVSESSWHHTDPPVFRRPSASVGSGPEPAPEDATPASTDPAALFRRPVR